ncbi:MAG: helix-turn-helix transcriptional regulator [Thermoplasmata archaeon]|nr:helix-turn-helix transcriptional regulator [Thermoplasmata archaeon]
MAKARGVSNRNSRAGAEPPHPVVPYETCPIAASLGTLGRKWALLVLRDVAFFPGTTFGAIRKNNPGLQNRVLSIRLKQLRAEGLIERVASPSASRSSGYVLTGKGRDIVPVLTAFIQYGARHHSDVVFADGRPRALDEVFPTQREFMVGELGAYARGERAPGSVGPVRAGLVASPRAARPIPR